MFDIGTIFGSVFSGWLSDKIGYRVFVLEWCIFLMVPSLLWLSVVGDPTSAYIASWFCGLTIGGAANLISGTVASDLGEK